MTPIMRVLIAGAAIFALLFQFGCTGSQLADVAKAEAALETGCNTATTIVTQANADGLIATADTTVILKGILQLEQANGQAITATAALNTLTASGQTSLLSDLQPVSTALQNLVANGTVNIKDAATKEKVQLALVTLQTLLTATLTVIQAVK